MRPKAASSNGPVHFLALPCRVDEQAVLGWADCPSPSYHYDYAHVQGWASAAGALTGFTLSGEEKQIDFTGAGTVLVQSSELDVMGSSTLMQLLAQLPLLGKEDLGRTLLENLLRDVSTLPVTMVTESMRISCHEKLGDLANGHGAADNAREHWQQAHDIAMRIELGQPNTQRLEK